MNSTTATTISLSWTSAGSVVDSYEVMWQRDTSGDCPDEDEGSMSITDGSTSLTLMGRQEDSSYSITVIATNAAGSSAVSNAVTAVTGEAGYYLLPLSTIFQKLLILGAHGYSSCFVILSVCHHVSAATRNKTTNRRY